ncbi:MAG: leucine--tRNA ligase [Chloroflexota bacterium]|nr:MAG: leucine--tRNA ligase [Chloroflexota bacterium]
MKTLNFENRVTLLTFLLIEPKWQKKWKDSKIYNVDLDSKDKKNYFSLTMFPYPSGDLHIGHWYAFTPADSYSRFKKMKGFNVLHTQGFDAFGLPAENAAISRNINPMKWTFDNIDNMRGQFNLMGNSYDWSRELITCTPEYYKWNQFFFLKMYEKGIAYRKNGAVWWDPVDQTTLANEQVVEGKSERSGADVVRKMMPQWYFKITDYAEELLEMDDLGWPEKIKHMQRNWIGKSLGTDVDFKLQKGNKIISTFTTRVDTIFGVTFIVLAPEHDLINEVTTEEYKEKVKNYIKNSAKSSEIERTSTEREKTGQFTGGYAINPMNNKKIPIFIGDYVLGTYGTGAVMGVPAHDQRDYEFAKKYELPVDVVISKDGKITNDLKKANESYGILINSQNFDGLDSEKAKKAITDFMEKNRFGKGTVTYHLRDWLISRQRYWGTPIPIFYDENENIIPVDINELPVVLPEAKEFMPTGQSPLTLDEEFLWFDHPKYGKLRRETDTMDTFVDSSWYHLRFASDESSKVDPFNKERLKNWLPVHQYTGGAEHAVMHLLYARFFNKVLRDLGFVDFDEPYQNLFNQGVLLKDHQKISKRSNPLAPDPLVKEFGADAVRLYLMFLGPWDQGGDWSDDAFNGITRWLNRVWDLSTRDADEIISNDENNKDFEILINSTIKKVSEDLERFKFNTSISTLMEYTNSLSKIWSAGCNNDLWKESIIILIKLLAPMAPHITEELWELNGQKFSVHNQEFPSWDDQLISTDAKTIVVQINGKVRSQFDIEGTKSEEEVFEIASNNEKVKENITGKEIIKKIYVKDKLVNFVVR